MVTFSRFFSCQFLFILRALALFVCVVCIHAKAVASTPVPFAVPPAPVIQGKAYILIDADTGHVIAEYNADERHKPASLNKIMTSYVLFHDLRDGHIGLDDTVRISEAAWRTDGSRSFLQVGTDIRLEDLLIGMIVQSGNDASVALAEHTAGDETAFASLMNQYAAVIGMENTVFANASGLPDDSQHTTARDLAMLTQSMIGLFPDYYSWYAIKEFTHNNITQRNRNTLLWRDTSVDGVKTGHTEQAGYNLVVSAERDGMRLIAVILGEENDKARVQSATKLLNYGFRFFTTEEVVVAGEMVGTVPVVNGVDDTVAAVVTEPVVRTVPRKQARYLDMVVRADTLHAPVRQGDVIGTLDIRFNDDVLYSIPVVAKDTVTKATLWQTIKRYFSFDTE